MSARTVKEGLSGLLIGLFLKGVICIDFAHFCKGIYGTVEGVANQDSFVVEVFKAAGSSYAFTKKGAYSASNYGAKLFNGGKPLSKKHRDSFPNPINTTGLVKFLSEHIKKASVRTVMNYFTIPTDADINIPALTKALADQLQIIIHEPNSDDDIIATNYQQYLSQPETDESSFHKPLCDGDAFWVETAPADRRHVVDFYEHFTHIWKLLNFGKVPWTGRRLICINEDSITPCAMQLSIDIPDTAPNGRAVLSVEFDARGDEDTFESQWVMVDKNNKECYPNYSSPFNITIVVENKTFKRSGGN